MNEEKLIECARLGMKNAFVPVSGFPVGAAVLTRGGNLYQGCNTESITSGMGVCAERSAIDHAVAHGEYCFKSVAVVSEFEDPICPCGMCLQYISEFSQVTGKDIGILMIGSNGDLKWSSIQSLLPNIFGPFELGLDLSIYSR